MCAAVIACLQEHIEQQTPTTHCPTFQAQACQRGSTRLHECWVQGAPTVILIVGVNNQLKLPQVAAGELWEGSGQPTASKVQLQGGQVEQ